MCKPFMDIHDTSHMKSDFIQVTGKSQILIEENKNDDSVMTHYTYNRIMYTAPGQHLLVQHFMIRLLRRTEVQSSLIESQFFLMFIRFFENPDRIEYTERKQESQKNAALPFYQSKQ